MARRHDPERIARGMLKRMVIRQLIWSAITLVIAIGIVLWMWRTDKFDALGEYFRIISNPDSALDGN